MIKTFMHKGLKRLFVDNDRRLLNSNHCDRILRILDRLDTAEMVEDMNLPGYNLHKLSGKKNQTWSIKISGNWRLTFHFESSHAYDVNLEDYH
jgi:proteic killer suppression protein